MPCFTVPSSQHSLNERSGFVGTSQVREFLVGCRPSALSALSEICNISVEPLTAVLQEGADRQGSYKSLKRQQPCCNLSKMSGVRTFSGMFSLHVFVVLVLLRGGGPATRWKDTTSDNACALYHKQTHFRKRYQPCFRVLA